ncbi:winged helix-turn-helix transcriptional regulator [Chryseolinea soli]|nr:helix-turn-helix domain-containing protein [Chryseolinea soli]
MTKQEVTKRLPLSQSKSVYENEQCSVIAALKLFATKWKPCIICFLAEHPLRYNALYRAIPNISRKMLSLHLDEMERDGLLTRVLFDSKLQRVEYRLSPKGLSLLPLMEQLQDWGLENVPGSLSIREMLDATRTGDL